MSNMSKMHDHTEASEPYSITKVILYTRSIPLHVSEPHICRAPFCSLLHFHAIGCMVDKDEAEPQPESALVLAGTSKRPLAIAGKDQDTKDNIDGEEMEEKEEEEIEEEIEEEEDARPLKKKKQLADSCPKNPLSVCRNALRPRTAKWH